MSSVSPGEREGEAEGAALTADEDDPLAVESRPKAEQEVEVAGVAKADLVVTPV